MYTIEEIKVTLDNLVNDVRTKLHITDSSTRVCKESSFLLSELFGKLNIAYIPFTMGEIGMSELEHHYGIAGFNTEFGQICVLLDLTYIQFTEKEYPVNVKNQNMSRLVLAPGNFMEESKINSLVQNGYLTLTQENFGEYIRSFIETYKLANPINEDLIYEKVYKKIEDYNINLVEKDYLNSQAIIS